MVRVHSLHCDILQNDAVVVQEIGKGSHVRSGSFGVVEPLDAEGSGDRGDVVLHYAQVKTPLFVPDGQNVVPRDQGLVAGRLC